jgi:hypothetical protein
LAIADQSRTEDYKNYWNNVFLPADMRAACLKKGAVFDDVNRECNITITLKQYGRSASNAKGLKIADNVGCDRTYTKIERIGAGTIECGGPVWNLPICFHADQQAIEDKQAEVKKSVVTAGIGVATGILTGVVAGIGSATKTYTCTGDMVLSADKCYNKKPNGGVESSGIDANQGKSKFNVGAALGAGLSTTGLAAVGGIAAVATAKNSEIKGSQEADVNCSTPDGATYGKGEMIDLRW